MTRGPRGNYKLSETSCGRKCRSCGLESTRSNARAFITVQQEFGSFDDYIWQFVDGQPIINCWKHWQEIPASTEISDALSEDLKKRGFRFVGSTICYAFMQAVGMVNDHTTDCYRHPSK